MDEYSQAKQAGAEVFKRAIDYIKAHSWNHNSMEILLKASNGQVWPQPMAVLMFSELEYALGSQSLTQFDQTATEEEVIDLFNRVITQLTTSN
jgi:hypothetical protein